MINFYLGLSAKPTEGVKRSSIVNDFPYLRAMRAKTKDRIRRYVVLVAGILTLLSIVLPHHHHADGSACYMPLTEEMAHADGGDPCGQGCCFGSHGLLPVSVGTDVGLHVFPLISLFAPYQSLHIGINPSLLVERPVYIESLYDSWRARATGLRGPPEIG